MHHSSENHIVEMIPEIKSAIMNSLIRSSEERLSCFDCKVKGLCACYCISVNLLILYMGEIVMLNIYLHNVIGCSMWEKRTFILVIEDDIHFIHALQHPCNTTTAWHMCTGLMDIQPSVSAITRPSECQKFHRVVPVVSKTGTIKQYREGVSIEAILEHLN